MQFHDANDVIFHLKTEIQAGRFYSQKPIETIVVDEVQVR